MKQKLEASIRAVSDWVENHHYRAYDPGDGCNTYLHALTFNVLMLERILLQTVARSPINLRPILGIRPHDSTKGRGYMAWGYIKLHRLTGERVYAERARKCLQWLIENKSPFYPQYCWGNHFPFCTRGGKIRALEPIIPWTVLNGQAFFEAYETWGDPVYREVLVSIGEWIKALPRERTASGDCISYVAYKQSSIHNANLLAASFLGQLGKLTDDRAALDAARQAVIYSCSRQEADGAWFYGAAEKYHWIDNFHTGYNLDCLKRYAASTGDRDFDGHRTRGFDYFISRFFEADGCPKYYHDKTLPIDIQCAGQAIDTLAFFSDEHEDALAMSCKVANWTIDHMQARDGHFYFRDFGWAKARMPMMHWGQGTMFKGMAHLLSKLELKAPPRGASSPATVSDRS